jgi:hypothetical protein
MRAALVTAVAAACIVVPQASAKGPLALCGPNACVTLAGETAVNWSPPADGSHATPSAPAPFLKLRFADHEGAPLAYWVPSAGLLRTAPFIGAPVWFKPTDEDAALLTQTATSLRPFAAPTRVNVTVNFRTVPRGDLSYLRLFTMGTPVAAASTRGWLPVDMAGPETPWTRCYDCLWVSRTGAWLKRSDGTLLSIPSRIAYLVRHRLPLR